VFKGTSTHCVGVSHGSRSLDAAARKPHFNPGQLPAGHVSVTSRPIVRPGALAYRVVSCFSPVTTVCRYHGDGIQVHIRSDRQTLRAAVTQPTPSVRPLDQRTSSCGRQSCRGVIHACMAATMPRTSPAEPRINACLPGTLSWSPALFDTPELPATAQLPQRPVSHVQLPSLTTSLDCSTCHHTRNWSTVNLRTYLVPDIPGESSQAPRRYACHTTTPTRRPCRCVLSAPLRRLPCRFFQARGPRRILPTELNTTFIVCRLLRRVITLTALETDDDREPGRGHHKATDGCLPLTRCVAFLTQRIARGWRCCVAVRCIPRFCAARWSGKKKKLTKKKKIKKKKKQSVPLVYSHGPFPSD